MPVGLVKNTTMLAMPFMGVSIGVALAYFAYQSVAFSVIAFGVVSYFTLLVVGDIKPS